MAMIDVHILSLPHRRGAKLERCLESVAVAASRAPFPVAVHVVECEQDGHLGRGRAKGYAHGSHPYVTNVDDDDWVEPDAFAVLAEALEQDPAAVYTSFYHHRSDGIWINYSRALLRVFKRDTLEGFDFERWPAKDKEGLIYHADTKGGHVYINAPVYHYDDDPRSSSKKITAMHPDILGRPELIHV